LFAERLEGEGGVCGTLRMLTALTSLDLWLHIPELKDHSAFFKSLMEACPKLTEVHFMCTTSFGVKPLLSLTEHLPLLPHLRTFSLTKGHKYIRDDSSMLATALRLIRSSKRNSGSSNSANPEHLKQEGTYDIIRQWDGDQSSVVTGVEVYEKGINVLGKIFTRRYRYDNFPSPSRISSSPVITIAASASSSHVASPTASSSHVASPSAASADASGGRPRAGRVGRGRFKRALMIIKGAKNNSNRSSV